MAAYNNNMNIEDIHIYVRGAIIRSLFIYCKTGEDKVQHSYAVKENKNTYAVEQNKVQHLYAAKQLRIKCKVLDFNQYKYRQ